MEKMTSRRGMEWHKTADEMWRLALGNRSLLVSTETGYRGGSEPWEISLAVGDRLRDSFDHTLTGGHYDTLEEAIDAAETLAGLPDEPMDPRVQLPEAEWEDLRTALTAEWKAFDAMAVESEDFKSDPAWRAANAALDEAEGEATDAQSNLINAIESMDRAVDNSI